MRFKLIYDDVCQKLHINCLKDENEDVILPKNPDQHVFYPLHNKLLKKATQEFQELIDPVDAEFFKEISDDIKRLTDLKSEKMHDLRVKYNEKIMEKAIQFKSENAEYFI